MTITFIAPAGAYSTDYAHTVVANSAINTNTANDLSPQDLLNVTLPGYAHAPFTSKFKGRLFAWTLNILAKFEVGSFTRSLDNRGYLKISEVPGYANAPFSPKF